MEYRRLAAAWGTFLVVGGVLVGTIGYGAYYRSDHYRRRVETDLTRFFGLPVVVGRVEPYSLTARRLRDLEIWLPQRRARIFSCPRVLWDTGPQDADGTVLDVHDATLTVGSPEWEREDYGRVLRASLQHNFRDLGITQVRFHNARLDWPRADFQLTADGVDGRVDFEPDGRGWASLTSHSLNGVTVTEPIGIVARIDPLRENFLPEVTLTVPTLPLGGLGLDHLLESPITQGSFAGRVTVRREQDADVIELAGQVHDIRLDEFTRLAPGGALPALVDLTIEQAVIRGRQLASITFRGELREVDVDALLSRLDWPAIGGTARVTVHAGRVVDQRIQSLRAEGMWVGGSLDKLSQALIGESGIRGQLLAHVNSVVLRGGELASGDIVLMAQPPAGEPGTIRRALLAELVQARLGLPLPDALLSMMPEQIEYVHLGARLVIDGQRVRVLSTTGPAGAALITLRLLNQDVPLLGQMDMTFPLDPLLTRGREELEEIRGKWQQRWGPRSTTRPTAPAAPAKRPPQ